MGCMSPRKSIQYIATKKCFSIQLPDCKHENTLSDLINYLRSDLTSESSGISSINSISGGGGRRIITIRNAAVDSDGDRRRRCVNCPPDKTGKQVATFTGSEWSPLGLGYSARYETVGKKRTGRDGNTWVARRNRWASA
jgi:hypothetical protein